MPRSEDWPNRSSRSLLIVNLGFSINSTRYCASLSAARGSQFSRTQCLALRDDEGMRAARSVEANHQGLLAMMDSQAGCTYELAIAPLFTMP